MYHKLHRQLVSQTSWSSEPIIGMNRHTRESFKEGDKVDLCVCIYKYMYMQMDLGMFVKSKNSLIIYI